jgi:hypothetical protein
MAPAAISDAGRITLTNWAGGDQITHITLRLLYFFKKNFKKTLRLFFILSFFLEQKIDSSLWELDL